MTRLEAEKIAAERNKGCERGVSYYANHRVGNSPMQHPNKWHVVQNDNGYERIVAS